MKYLSEYRDPEKVQEYLSLIADAVTQPWNIMEICGGQTHAIIKSGLDQLLPPQIDLVHGPGCPVCVTPVGYVDHAVALARRPDTFIATFGDMVRVPGSSSSLIREQAKGAQIKIVYSPLDAVSLAERNPEKEIIFLGVGFETTTPTIAGAVLTAEKKKLKNFSVLTSHKTMPAPMAVLISDPELEVDGYLCPAHVSAIIGSDAYKPLVDAYKVPAVITGFEPLDVLQGIAMLAKQVVNGEAKVETQYSRVVRPEGNPKAREILYQVFQPCSARWRGIGDIPDSGLELRPEYEAFNAASKLPVEVEEPREHAGCLCGEILKGKVRPTDCDLFKTICTPEDPVGACMVSSEGTCAAEYKYGS